MKLIDITTRSQLDDAIETAMAMAMATGCLSDREIVEAMRAAAETVGFFRVDHSVVVATKVDDPACYKTAGLSKQMFMVLATYGQEVAPAAFVTGLFEQKADEYEEEIG